MLKIFKKFLCGAHIYQAWVWGPFAGTRHPQPPVNSSTCGGGRAVLGMPQNLSDTTAKLGRLQRHLVALYLAAQLEVGGSTCLRGSAGGSTSNNSTDAVVACTCLRGSAGRYGAISGIYWARR